MRQIILTSIFYFNFSLLFSQNIGIGTVDPKATLDIAGDLILKSSELSVLDGNTLNLDINTNKLNHYKLIGPTGNYQIGGIAAAEHDRIITLYNRSGHSLEIYNDDANAIGPNKIYTGTGGTFAVYNGGSVTLKYDITIQKWEITASHYNSLDNFGSGNWTLSGNDIYNGNVGNVGIGTSSPSEKLEVNGSMNITGEIKPAGQIGQLGEVLQSNGNGTMAWMPPSNSNGNVGFGSWGCEMDNLTAYNPVFASDGAAMDGFGTDADIHENFAIIGAKDATVDGKFAQGCAYIFHFDGQKWVEMQKITASDGIASDEFGNSVAIFGNWAIVGASKADFNGNFDRGASYIYHYNGSSWVEHQKIIDPAGVSNNLFGYDNSISATHIIIGNVGSNDFTGSVHTYTFDGNFWVPDQVVLANDGNFEDWFGFSISLFEDKMVIGAALDDVGAPYGGSAYFFELINNTWTFHSKMADDTPVFSGGFGTSVSLTDNYAAIGDFHNNIHFVEFKNDQWIRKSKKLISQLSTVSISNEYSITSGGVLLKSTGNQWYQYEKANDPQDISNGAIFKTVAIDQITFVMCAPTALNNSGLAIFGKIK